MGGLVLKEEGMGGVSGGGVDERGWLRGGGLKSGGGGVGAGGGVFQSGPKGVV